MFSIETMKHDVKGSQLVYNFALFSYFIIN